MIEKSWGIFPHPALTIFLGGILSFISPSNFNETGFRGLGA